MTPTLEKKKKQAAESAYEIDQISNLTDFKVAIMNVFQGLKETMIKEVQ